MNNEDQEIEKAAEDVNSFYDEAFDRLSIEIMEGVEEGFKEGVKAGIKKGLLQIIECNFLGYSEEECSSTEDILKESFSEGLTKTASTMTERNVCPILKTWLENRCDEAVERLSSRGLIKTSKHSSNLAKILKIEEKADKKYGELSDQAKRVLPPSFIVQSFFEGIQSALWSCTKDGVKSCQERITEMSEQKGTS